MKCCCVRGCRSNSNDVNVSFYRFPKVSERYHRSDICQGVIEKRRQSWFNAVRMKKNVASIDQLDNARICSKHFKLGKPSHFSDVDNEDWVPTIDVNVEHESPKLRRAIKRHGVRIKSTLKKKKLFEEVIDKPADIDEIRIQKASMLDAQSATYSSYKSANTDKYLVAITPLGSVCFLSHGYGGRASDKFITEDCGILDYLQAGDLVLADRGFTVHELVHELVAKKGATLVVPDFKNKNSKQLTPYQIENTRGIASVCIHVECVIGSIGNKFRITQGPIPITMLRDSYENVKLIDYILRTLCILNNMCESIVNTS